MQYTSTARREAELKKLLSNGSVPKPPKFWSAHLDDVDVTSEDFEDPVRCILTSHDGYVTLYM